MLRTSLSALLLMIMSTIKAQSSFQELLEFSPGDSATIVALIPSTDGSTIAVLPSGPEGYVLRRFGASGQHEWSKRIQSPALRNPWAGNGTGVPSDEWSLLWSPFSSDGNGGVLYCYATMPEWRTDGIGLDTNITHTTIMRIAPDGSVMAFDDLRHTLVLPADSMLSFMGTQHVSSTMGVDGDLLVMEHNSGYFGGTNIMQMTRLSSTNEVEMTKWYHAPGDAEWQSPLGDQGQFCWLISDTASGAFLVDGFQGRVSHFSSQGSCEWVKRHHYGAVAFPQTCHPLLDPITNELILADDIETFSARKQLVLHVPVSGILQTVWVFDYQTNTNFISYSEKVGLLSDGSMVIGENAYGPQEAFTLVEPGGAFAHHYAPWQGNSPVNAFVQDWNVFAPNEDNLIAAGRCDLINVPLGTNTPYSLLASFPAAELGGCLRIPSTSNMVDGLPAITTTVDPAWIDTPPGQATAVLPLAPPAISVVNPPTVIDMCSFTTDVHHLDAVPGLEVRPTCVEAGHDITIDLRLSGILQLLTVDGRPVRRMSVLPGSVSLSTIGLAPAVYLLQYSDNSSRAIGHTRIVVQ